MSETQQSTQTGATAPGPEGTTQPQTEPTKSQQPTTEPAKAEPTTSTTPTEGGEKSLLNQDGKKPEAAQGAPEKYADFTAPEGFEIKPEVAEEAGKLFKSMNLTQEQAQSLVDFYAAKTREAAEGPVNFYKERQDQEVAKINADPDIGGKLDQVKATVSRALDGLGNPQLAADFRADMDFTGAGNFHSFVKVLFALAQKVTEGGPVTGKAPSRFGQTAPGTGDRRTAASALYPNLPSSQ